MNKKRITAFILALLLLIGTSSALAAGGADDPLISLKYISDSYINSMLDKGRDMISKALDGQGDSAYTSASFTTAKLARGSTVTLRTGGSVILNSGSATLYINSGCVINLTTGVLTGMGSIGANERYMAAEDSVATVTLLSDSEIIYDGDVTVNAVTVPNTFSDVPSSYWAFEYVEKLAKTGFVSGTGNGMFTPTGLITRADFVTVLGRAAGVNAGDYSSCDFTDVMPGQYYTPYIQWAAEKGIVSGTGDGTFLPLNYMTRSEMAVLIVNYAKYMGLSTGGSNTGTPFADDSSIESWARDAVYTARGMGVISGKGGNVFDPGGHTSRAEVCTVVCRLLGI